MELSIRYLNPSFIDTNLANIMTEMSKECPFPEHYGEAEKPSWQNDLIPERSPYASPYASPICNLYFQGQCLQIHEDFLRSSTELASRWSPTLLEGTGLKNLYFDEISIDVGHVIANFLTTGEYPRSKTQGECIIGEGSSEFLTALRVCAAAESLKLPVLRSLATDKAKDLCAELNILSILQLTHDLSSVPAEVASYITCRVKEFCEELTEDSATLFWLGIATPKTVCELLLKTVIEVKIQQLSSTAISRAREIREEGATAAGLYFDHICERPHQFDPCTEHPVTAGSNPFAVFTPSDPSRFPLITPLRSPELYHSLEQPLKGARLD